MSDSEKAAGVGLLVGGVSCSLRQTGFKGCCVHLSI